VGGAEFNLHYCPTKTKKKQTQLHELGPHSFQALYIELSFIGKKVIEV
jgi:hypothetical protein